MFTLVTMSDPYYTTSTVILTFLYYRVEADKNILVMIKTLAGKYRALIQQEVFMKNEK